MDTQKRIIIWASAILVVGVTIVGIWSVANSDKVVTSPGNGIIAENITAGEWTKGAENPKVTLVEYSDFQCPACAFYYSLVDKVIIEYGDRISFTYRHFPLPQHKNALTASYASEAAGKQGKFWEMNQMLFERQSKWAESYTATDIFTGYAKELNLNLDQYKKDVSSREVKENVSHDRATGVASKVGSTPSFFLNGKKMQNPRTYEEFRALIEYALVNG